VRVEINPDLLVWARERSGLAIDDLERRFPKLGEWERGDRSPTLKQLEGFASATHTPIGFLLLAEPPDERVPIPDLRTLSATDVRRPSADLLDTIYLCEQRQEWYRAFAQVAREDPVGFAGSLTTRTPVEEAAMAIRRDLEFEVEQRGPTWGGAFRLLVGQAESRGVLVMVSGIVGSNTHRKLDPREFRGFALVDALAPLVFVNGADTKAAQIFTLAHELAHVWLGETALSDADLSVPATLAVERWCNEVAAEILVPRELIVVEFRADDPLTEEIDRLARRFKVSTLVVLRRLRDVGALTAEAFRAAYEAELERILALMDDRAASGGDFFNTQPARVSRRFARAVIASTLEGQTLYRDAFQLLGFKKLSTFHELADRLGVG
jgi:Zn-dependent peptidase ImmA (M78 family)